MRKSYADYLGPEDRLHIACCDWLELQYPNLLFTHPANEAKRTKFEQYKAKMLRMKSGVPDLLIFTPFDDFSGLAIEFKVKPNKCTENQNNWLEGLKSSGWYTWVCYDLENFMNLINDCYQARNPAAQK